MVNIHNSWGVQHVIEGKRLAGAVTSMLTKVQGPYKQHDCIKNGDSKPINNSKYIPKLVKSTF